MLIELSRSLLKKDGYYPVVGVIQNRYNPHIEIVEVARDNNIASVVFPCEYQFDYRVISRIHSYIQDNRISILHCHGYKSNFYGLSGSLRRIPAVTTNHNWLTYRWRLKIYCLLDSIWIRYFDRIVAVSEDVKKDMMRYFVPGDKIDIIDNGIDVGRFTDVTPNQNLKNELGLSDNAFIIGIIGNLGHEKGHEYLFEAVKLIRRTGERIKILVVGDGYLKDHLQKKTVALGISEDVIFTGYRKDIPELLSLIDIFVLPSVREGLPMVILEAMASRRPVIATRVGAIPKVIRHGENGFIVTPSNPMQLRDAIVELTENKVQRQKLAENGFITVTERFSSDIMCHHYTRIYEDLVSHTIN